MFLSSLSFGRAVRPSLLPRGSPLPRHIFSIRRDGPMAATTAHRWSRKGQRHAGQGRAHVRAKKCTEHPRSKYLLTAKRTCLAPEEETVVAERAKMAAPRPRSRGTERDVYGAVAGVGGRVGRERRGGLWAPEEAPGWVGGRVEKRQSPLQVFAEHLWVFFEHLYFVANPLIEDGFTGARTGAPRLRL